MTAAILLTITGVVFIVAVHEERAIRREVRRAMRMTQARMFREAMEIPTEPHPDLRAWTPQEREALGVNDTIALISRIDKELGREYAEVKRTPPQHIRITNQEAS